MSWLKKILPHEAKSGTKNEELLIGSKKLKPESIAMETLQQLFPVRNLGEDALASFVTEHKSEVFGSGSVLFNQGGKEDFVIFLLEGKVLIETDGGKDYIIEGGTSEANFPLSSGKFQNATAYAKSDIRVLRTSNRIMQWSNRNSDSSDILDQINSRNLPEELRHSNLFTSFQQCINDNELEFPTLPDIAVKLRNAMQKDDIGIADAVKIIQLDPIITAKLIQVANSPLYIAANPASSCQDAVNRIGLIATRNLVTSISLKQFFKTKDPKLKKRIQELWKNCLHIASLSFVLAKLTKVVEPDTAFLAGLVVNIGVIPFLSFVEQFPTEYYKEADIDLVLPQVSGPVGSLILKQWDFPEELVDIPNISENWYHDEGDNLNLGDIIVLAKLHSFIGSRKIAEMPPINSIPACGKLGDNALSPENSLKILHDAKDQINSAMEIF